MEIKQAVISDIPKLCVLLDSLSTQETEFESNHEAQVLGLTATINKQYYRRHIGCTKIRKNYWYG